MDLNKERLREAIREFVNGDFSVIVETEQKEGDLQIRRLIIEQPKDLELSDSEKLVLESERAKVTDKSIKYLLKKIGIPTNIFGYQYITDAILMLQENPTLIKHVTKYLYPDIAKKNNTTSSRVERAIRHAIEIAWCAMDNIEFDEIFVNSINKPTNCQFLATVNEYLS